MIDTNEEMKYIQRKIMSGLKVSDAMMTYARSSISDRMIPSISDRMKMTCDEYIKFFLPNEMRNHSGRKRLRKKKAKAALQQRWRIQQLTRPLFRRINYTAICRKIFTVAAPHSPEQPIYIDIDIADVVAGGEE